MSGSGDNMAAAGQIAPPAPLLVVVEPVSATGDAVGAFARLALAAEALRLAAALGAQTRFVTWEAGPEVDFASLAAAVADLAKSARPVAVLVQDGDSGRQLAPFVAQALGTGAVFGVQRRGGRR